MMTINHNNGYALCLQLEGSDFVKSLTIKPLSITQGDKQDGKREDNNTKDTRIH